MGDEVTYEHALILLSDEGTKWKHNTEAIESHCTSLEKYCTD